MNSVLILPGLETNHSFWALFTSKLLIKKTHQYVKSSKGSDSLVDEFLLESLVGDVAGDGEHFRGWTLPGDGAMSCLERLRIPRCENNVRSTVVSKQPCGGSTNARDRS